MSGLSEFTVEDLLRECLRRIAPQFDEAPATAGEWLPLQQGDLILEGDEWWDDFRWCPTACHGDVYRGVRPHRRLFPTGYRWLRAGDTVVAGDEILCDGGKWVPVTETGPYDPVVMQLVRRKIT